ncbi:MAG: hypothetical protein AAF597_09510, partial [Bacteroidota bacterium]
LAWKREDDGRIAFRWNRNLNVSGGVAIMLPEGEDNLSARFARYAAGGPVASLLLVLIGLGIRWVMPEGNFFRLLGLMMALFSGFIFIATVIPFRAGGFASDGMRVLTLLRGGPAAKADLAIIRSMGILRSGRPYTDLPLAEFEAMEADDTANPIQRVTGYYYRYLYCLSIDELDQAAAFLQQTMDNLSVYPKGMDGGFYLEEALFAAKYPQDLPAAESAFGKFQPNPVVEPLSIALAQAAIAELKGDNEALQQALPIIEQGLSRTIDQSRVPTIKTWLKSWKDGIKTVR